MYGYLDKIVTTLSWVHHWKKIRAHDHEPKQNRRQKVFSRGALRSCGGALGFCGGA